MGRGGTLSDLGQSSHVALDSILLTVMLAITVRRRRTVDGVRVCVCAVLRQKPPAVPCYTTSQGRQPQEQ